MLPDLPLHGDSEERPRHPYTPDWFADVLAGFSHEVLGPRPLIGGHGLGAEILLHAVAREESRPARLILLPNRLHRRAAHEQLRRGWRIAARAGAIPGLDARSRTAPGSSSVPTSGCGCPRAARPARATSSATPSPTSAATRTSPARGRASRRAGRRGAQHELLDLYPRLKMPVLLLWADDDHLHPLSVPRRRSS